jgi:hypothetical protein
MKILKKILLSAGLLIIIVVVFLAYLGYFSSVKVEEKQEGGYTVVGVNVTGPYSKAGKYISNVDSKLKEAGINSIKDFGIYYDDPKNTPAEKCRSLVGVIIDKRDLEKVLVLELKDIKIDSIPRANSVVAEFPLKNMISYMVGPMKAYPAISDRMKEKNYKTALSFEIYDKSEEKIIFVMQYTSN